MTTKIRRSNPPAEARDDAAADWAENEMTLPERSPTARRGAAAAAHGAAALERATGGRPSIDPSAPAGQHARTRQVRLAADVDQELAALAAAQSRSVSAVLRDALSEYLGSRVPR